MFTIAYNKQTKFILYSRYDASTNVDKPTPLEHLNNYCEINNLNASDFQAIELPWNPKAQYIIGRDLFDETNNTIYADPNWVEPVLVESTPAEPTV